ncbi:hypothetical protein MHU86_24244 [Fragilaria crotonensis]|nr:hypothetical protein MHU86_24244 [Fragilaria crotonensis]
MRFRPASINYLEDAASHHTFSMTVLNVVVQRVQDGERSDDEDNANDTDDEEPFELRSIHSGDSDDFHPYCNDDDGQITVDFGNLVQVTDNSISLPSCSIDPTKPLDITYEASNISDTLSSTIVLRLNWYIFLNQRRQFLPKTPTSEETKCGEMKHIGTDHTDLIPLPFLQVIQAIASCPGTAITSLRCTQTKVKSKSHDAGHVQALSTSRHFDVAIRTRHLEENTSTSGRLALQDGHEVMSGTTKLLTERIEIRQAKYQNEIVEISKPSFVCDVSPFSHHSPVRSVASTTFTIASMGEDHLGDTNLDARSLFDEILCHDSQNLSQTLPTPVDEPNSKSKRTLEHQTNDHKKTSKRLCFESPPEACSNEHPSPGMRDFEFPLHDDESCVDYQPVLSIEEFNTETAISGRENKATEKEQKKRRKEKKAKKKKKRSRRDVEEELEHQLTSEGNTASCLTTYGVSKITPEPTRGKGQPRQVAPFFDPRVKSHNAVYKRSPFLSQVTIEQGGSAFFEARGEASQQVTATTMKVVPHRPDPRPSSLQYIDHFDEPRDASNDDDGLEIPHESPEPPTKRKRDEGPWERSAAASMTAKQIRNSEESSQEVHVLCSESFIEHSSQVIASLASGSWLEETLFENYTLSNSEAQAHCRRILAHDSSLLDEVGIDIEIPGKEQS